MKKSVNIQSCVIGVVLPMMIFMVTQLNAQVTISAKTDVTCYGAQDGTATATVTGGTPPYTYSWSPGGGNAATATGLSGGTYTVEVTDANNCKANATVEIQEPSQLSVSVAQNGVLLQNCGNQNPSQVTLTATASGGDPPYNYSWPGGSITVSSPNAYNATVIDSKGCSKTATVNVGLITVLCAIDPNDITGPEGYDTLHWIRKDEQMPFMIRFENDPEFATAAAQVVTINQPVHPNLNIFSFRLGDFGFGDFTFNVPANTTFYTQRLDVRDSLGIFVDVVAGIDIIKNELFWIFESIDPITGTAPLDATLGFLPVNDSIRRLGEGFVNYTILPKTSITSGDTITAQASIVFDINEAIETNIWKNTIDALPPVSNVVDNFSSYSDTTSIPIIFNGSDDPDGSGIRSFKLYYSKNNAPFELYQEFSADTMATFTATSGYYRFYSIAEDFVGNQEPQKTVPDAEVTIISNLKFAVEGTTQYANFNSSPLGSSTVYLKTPGGDILDSVSTDNFGQYQLENVSTGMFVLDASTAFPWGGVNATDALIINRAAVSLYTLDSVQEIVADVNSSGTITATDALLALRRSLGLDNMFSAGDWYFLTDTILIKGDSLFDKNIKGVCIGDVNYSYQPVNARLFRSITPEYDEVLVVNKSDFMYPLYFQTAANLGAIDLTIKYPSENLEILDVHFKGKGLMYNDLGGIIRIGWQDLSGEEFNPDDPLLEIRMKYKQSILEKNSLQPTIIEPSEIADIHAEVLYGTRIIMPEIQYRESIPDEFALIGNYPNPCEKFTTFNYLLPESGIVEIQLFNTLGELVKSFKLGEQQAGEHHQTVELGRIAAGVYHYSLSVVNNNNQHNASGRLIVGTKK